VITDKYFSRYEYAVRYRPIVGRVYTGTEAARLASLHKHCDPWWSEEEEQLHLKYLLPQQQASVTAPETLTVFSLPLLSQACLLRFQ
jgi:hypothetical protein